MAYAPILDPASYSSETEPRRQLALAAARLLQRLAGDLDTFKMAVEATAPDREGHQTVTKVLKLLQVDSSVEAEHLLDEQVLRQLLEQLQQVREFSELDGGSWDDHISAIARMIRAGRVELFAGRSARASRHPSR